MTSTAAPASTAAERALAWTPRGVAALLAVTMLAAGLRLYGLSQWSYDAAEAAGWQLVAAPAAAAPPTTAQRSAPLGWLLLQALTAAGLLPTSGEGWLRLPAALAGILAAPLLAVAVRPWCGAAPALLAAALLAVHPAAVAASQALDPVAFAVLCALGAGAAALRQRRGLAAALAVVAAATAPAAIGALLAIALLAAPARRHRELAAALGVLAAVAGLAALGAAAVPLLAFAACGWPLAPRPVRLAIGATVLGAAGVALAGGDGGRYAPAGAVPGLAALAAVGLAAAAAALRAAFAGSLRPVAAAAPALVVFAWLGVEVFLQATVHRGARTPWRAVADAAWTAAADAPTFLVAAGAGRGSLDVYLGASLASGIAVAPFDPAAGVDALRALAAAPAPAVLLALRSDERARLDAAAQRELADGFRCCAVVASPQLHGDDSVAVYRRREPAAARPR
jgi:hypothetical protein